MKILITGSRDWWDAKNIGRALDPWPRDSLIIDGMARGADQMAYDISKNMGFTHHARFPALCARTVRPLVRSATVACSIQRSRM